MYEDKYTYINDLVTKAKKDDRKALFQLYDFYKPLILSSIKRCLIKEPKLKTHKEDLIFDAIFVLEDLKLQLKDINGLVDDKTMNGLDNNQLNSLLNQINWRSPETNYIKLPFVLLRR